MRTTTQKFELSGDTVFLARSLKRIASRPRQTRLTEWMARQLERELTLRARAAMSYAR